MPIGAALQEWHISYQLEPRHASSHIADIRLWYYGTPYAICECIYIYIYTYIYVCALWAGLCAAVLVPAFTNHDFWISTDRSSDLQIPFTNHDFCISIDRSSDLRIPFGDYLFSDIFPTDRFPDLRRILYDLATTTTAIRDVTNFVWPSLSNFSFWHHGHEY